MTALLFTEAPLMGTFHRAGASSAYAAFKPLVRWAADHLDYRCAVSEDAAATAQAAMGGEYEVLFNGIDIERFAKVDPWPTEAPTIFFVGRHEPRKGLGVLIEALPMVGTDFRVWIGGEGEETAELRAATKGDDRVEWLGVITDHEKASRLRGAHVFCAPSRHGESFGVVLLEAMAAETPIVASDLPGYRRVARPDVDALLVRPDDAAELAKALTRVLANCNAATELVASGQSRAVEFSMERLAERYLTRYLALVG
jgi:phosphatidylinositol alpha-mannosyltransferase